MNVSAGNLSNRSGLVPTFVVLSRFVFALVALLCVSPINIRAETFYTNNFENAEVGSVPGDLIVLDGLFSVKEEGGNRFLELPGAPTDTYTVMFGPVTNVNIAVSARIHSTNKGRRMPAFGVSLCGVGGYKLQVAAAKQSVELFKGDELVKKADYKWKSGEWTSFHLSAVKTGNGVRVEGKISQEGTEPVTLIFEDTNLLTAGPASITGTPFAGTPIWFDDLAVVEAGR